MIHLDLFSGIGGFALAVDTVWPGAEHIFCEVDEFCQAVLKKHWPGSVIINDIKNLSRDRLIADSKDKQGGGKKFKEIFSNVGTGIDLLTGGFPCQPFSQAGKRKGKNDERWLWPEMLRAIREFQPTWIIAENVNGLISMAQRQGELAVDSSANNEEENAESGTADGVLCEIIDSLQQLGYSVQAFVIPACAVGAPHRRDRVWIIAHDEKRGLSKSERTRERWSRFKDYNRNAPNTSNAGLQGSKQQKTSGKEAGTSRSTSKCFSDVKDSGSQRWRGRDNGNSAGVRRSLQAPGSDRWCEPWPQVAACLCSVDDGLFRRLVRLPDNQTIFSAGQHPPVKPPTITAAHWRKEALKAAGNAIVPQVAIEIMRGIKNDLARN